MDVWDVRQNKVTKYQDRALSGLCLQGGYVSYRARERLDDREEKI